jgi:ABC-type nitrate/sulfonate/bicarbonate transport system permease component
MNTDTNGFLIYVVLVVIVAVIAHACIRRFWITTVFLAMGCSILNIAHEIVTHGFHIRPSDVTIWLPMIFVYGVALAFPIALLVGLPFHYHRRSRNSA